MEGTFGQNLVPTGTISPNFWGALGVKPPPVMKLDSLTLRFYIQVNDKDNVDSHQPWIAFISFKALLVEPNCSSMALILQVPHSIKVRILKNHLQDFVPYWGCCPKRPSGAWLCPAWAWLWPPWAWLWPSRAWLGPSLARVRPPRAWLRPSEPGSCLLGLSLDVPGPGLASRAWLGPPSTWLGHPRARLRPTRAWLGLHRALLRHPRACIRPPGA